MKLYERHGVKEYWLVFPLEKTIMLYELTEKGYELFSSATEEGKVKSNVLEGFELDVEEIFKEL
ncbi:Uma2 family endonuclease [Hydrogenobacter sp. T-2]|uniref:Uma2 family endonuclease n=1 Tax=Pampinifervens diazotrophicum TaxID=1632018 RepID=UPI002B263B4D|nr:Uma2 family endonuclease [Hydrogenobacter sp. T-2]WPM32083.1 Uma2 family endonuclease [Hydrogenobacter sp. T-2]